MVRPQKAILNSPNSYHMAKLKTTAYNYEAKWKTAVPANIYLQQKETLRNAALSLYQIPDP